jgi:hypothetical protein
LGVERERSLDVSRIGKALCDVSESFDGSLACSL